LAEGGYLGFEGLALVAEGLALHLHFLKVFLKGFVLFCENLVFGLKLPDAKLTDAVLHHPQRAS
jgi:hypothetical protein